MNKNSIISDQNPSADDLKELLRILQLDGNQRKKQHIDYLVEIMQIIPFFLKFRDEGDEYSQRLFCKYLKYEYYHPSQIIFRTGQYGDKFYVILAGKVGIYSEKHQMINLQDVLNEQNQQIQMKQNKQEEIKLVKVLDAGASFGEMALYDDNQQRVSSVFAHTDTFLGVIKREDYLNVMKKKQEKQRLKNIKNLCSISLFQGWNMKDIQIVAAKIKTVNCNKDEIIYQENQQVQSVFLVLSGTLLITKNNENNEWEDFNTSVNEIMKKESSKQEQNQKLRLIQAHELFGEEELLNGQKKRIHKVTCISDIATIYQMDISTFENDILNKNLNTKQEILKRMQNKLEDLSNDNQEKPNEYQNLLTKNYRTINLRFEKEDKEKLLISQRDKSGRKIDKNDKIFSVNSIQDSQRSRKNTKIIISKKSMGKSKNLINQSLNCSPNQNSLENLKTNEGNQSFNGYGADYITIEKDNLKSAQKTTITPIKERNSIKNEVLSDLPSLYQKVKAQFIHQSDNSRNPNSIVLQNPDNFILNFLPGVKQDLTSQMEQLHSQRNQELQDSILQKIQRTKTTESTKNIQPNQLSQQDGVKGSQIFGNFDHLQRKKKMMIEQAFYYRSNEQKQYQQQQQNVNNFSLHYGDQNYPMAIVLPNKLYKDTKQRSNSINSIQVHEDQQYKQSLKNYLMNLAQQQNRDKVNEMYNTEVNAEMAANNYSDINLANNHSTLQYKKRLSQRQHVSLRSSPKNLYARKLKPLY